MISVVFVMRLHNCLTSPRFDFGCSFLFAGNQDLFLSINKVFLFSPDLLSRRRHCCETETFEFVGLVANSCCDGGKPKCNNS